MDAATAAGAGLIGWAILIVLLLKTGRRDGDTYNINQTVHAEAKWFGRIDTDFH
ncbi:Integral membrane protein OS=Streptomyces rimosus subsp. rimosus (strain ATCC / DSM 40260 /JCM 4667 / NRRL 2234) OX=1265868 GN=SRIM_017355 PE=4 SV=1 [Streptomyces rimosus subsp. rimosus]